MIESFGPAGAPLRHIQLQAAPQSSAAATTDVADDKERAYRNKARENKQTQ